MLKCSIAESSKFKRVLVGGEFDCSNVVVREAAKVNLGLSL